MQNSLANLHIFDKLCLDANRGVPVSEKNEITVLTRNARFLWLGGLFVPPLLAFLAYQLTPHEELWHDVLFGLFCVPVFCVWVLAVLGCIISFVSYRSTARS